VLSFSIIQLNAVLQNYFFSADLQGMQHNPPALRPGDTIALAAPARFCTAEQVNAMCDLIANNGFEPHIPDNLLAREHQMAGNDTHRAAVLNTLMHNQQVKAILCMRGGYGSARLLPFLALSGGWSPPYLCGFSDITALHAAIQGRGGVSLHSPVGTTLLTAPPSVQQQFFDVLRGTCTSVEAEATAIQRGKATGKLVGGNLSVLYSLQGTPWFPTMDGAILLIEDIDEMRYHLDRMLTNFRQAGVFDRIAGLVAGNFTALRDNTRAFGFDTDNPFGADAREIIQNAVQGYDFPVCFDFPCGHETTNFTLPLGKMVTFEVNENRTRIEF
jgi:muramoyltetrapeptide carboxypeptidase